VVDNEELSNAFLSLYKAPLADFKAQVHQWVEAEATAIQQLDEEVIHSRRNHTILVVSFGVWDLWNVIEKDYETATKSIDRSIQIITEQLDLLSQNWGPDGLKLILTLAPDVTFLPAFRPLGEKHIGRYKAAVKLVARWNRKLRAAAEQWGRGTIYLFDTEAFLTDLIRDRQLSGAGVEQANGLGKNQDPGWENVEEACVASNPQWAVTSESKRCEAPEKYLFW
jgi:HMG box factor